MSTKGQAPSMNALFGVAEAGGDARSNKEQVLDAALQQMWSTDDIDLKTDLNATLILHMSRAEVFINAFPQTKVMHTFVNAIQRLSVSKGRKGREEAVQIIKASHEEADDATRSLSEKLFGR